MTGGLANHSFRAVCDPYRRRWGINSNEDELLMRANSPSYDESKVSTDQASTCVSHQRLLRSREDPLTLGVVVLSKTFRY